MTQDLNDANAIFSIHISNELKWIKIFNSFQSIFVY